MDVQMLALNSGPLGPALCRWVDSAACATQPDLPWTSDSVDVSESDRQAMSAVCAQCPVLASCEAAADLMDACAAYWAGRHRDNTEDADVEWLTHPSGQGAGPRAESGVAVVWEQGAVAWPGLDGVA